MPRLVLMVLSGTESNRLKFIPRLGIFNPELVIIGFPGTVQVRAIIYIYINNNNNNNIMQ